MGITFNLGAIAFCLVALIGVILFLHKQLRQGIRVDLNIVWIMAIVIFVVGLAVQALNMSKIYANICSGPDTAEIAQKLKQALLYRYAYNFLAVTSLIIWGILRKARG